MTRSDVWLVLDGLCVNAEAAAFFAEAAEVGSLSTLDTDDGFLVEVTSPLRFSFELFAIQLTPVFSALTDPRNSAVSGCGSGASASEAPLPRSDGSARG